MIETTKSRLSTSEIEGEFRKAVHLLKSGDRHTALGILHRICAEGSNNPLHRSYRGLAIALTGNGIETAETLCKDAMVLGFLEPEVYLNLARVYTLKRRPKEALRVLRQGIRSIPGDAAILRELERLNPRRPAAFSVVPRDHWLNNAFGRMQRKGEGGRTQSTSDSTPRRHRFGPSTARS